MALNTYDGSSEAEVQAEPLDSATSFRDISSDSPKKKLVITLQEGIITADKINWPQIDYNHYFGLNVNDIKHY